MSRIEFEDKEDIRTVDLPRKNYVGAADINEVKSAVNNIALLTHEVTLTKAQLNTINTDGGVAVPLSDFGCAAGEDIVLHRSYSIAEVFRDGVDFDSINQNLKIEKDSVRIAFLPQDIIQSSVDGRFGDALQSLQHHLLSTSDYVFTCNTDITGGGASAYIKIKFFYQIVTV